MFGLFKRLLSKESDENVGLIEKESLLSFQLAQYDDIVLSDDPKDLHLSYINACKEISYNHPVHLNDEIIRLQEFVAINEGINSVLVIEQKLQVAESAFNIEPFVLFPLLQNAIRYNYYHSTKMPIRLRIKLMGHTLLFDVSNRINPYITNQAETSYIRYLKSRLKLHYPERYELFINSNGYSFKASLKIILL